MRLNGGWTENVIFDFDFAQGQAFPQSTLIVDGAGNLYGTTESGGQCCGGTV